MAPWLTVAAVALAASATAGVAGAACVALTVAQSGPRLFSVDVGFSSSSADCPAAASRVGLALLDASLATVSSLTVFQCAAANVSTYLAVPASVYSTLVGQSVVVQATTWLVSDQNVSDAFEIVTSSWLTFQPDDASAADPSAIASCGVRTRVRRVAWGNGVLSACTARVWCMSTTAGSARIAGGDALVASRASCACSVLVVAPHAPVSIARPQSGLSGQPSTDRSVEFIMSSTWAGQIQSVTLRNLNGYYSGVVTIDEAGAEGSDYSLYVRHVPRCATTLATMGKGTHCCSQGPIPRILPRILASRCFRAPHVARPQSNPSLTDGARFFLVDNNNPSVPFAVTPTDGSSLAPTWQLAFPFGGLQYLASMYNASGVLVATAQCAIVMGPNSPPQQTAPLRLYLYSGIPVSFFFSARSGWVTDDYTSTGALALTLSGACAVAAGGGRVTPRCRSLVFSTTDADADIPPCRGPPLTRRLDDPRSRIAVREPQCHRRTGARGQWHARQHIPRRHRGQHRARAVHTHARCDGCGVRAPVRQ